MAVDIRLLMKRLNRFCLAALEEAANLCVQQGGDEVTVEQFLLRIVDAEGGDIPPILSHYGLDRSALRRRLDRSPLARRPASASRPVLSAGLLRWIEQAWVITSIELEAREIRSAALLLAVLADPVRFGQSDWFSLLRPVPADDLKSRLAMLTAASAETADVEQDGGAAAPARADSALGRFTVNFTERARRLEIDTVFCRDGEIRQIIDILGRRRKNNPIAVGEAGVGKTAVIEGLALKIVEGDIPPFLANVELLGLDLGLLQAGASVKGEFENRLKRVIEEVKASPRPVILFIDEAHTLVGAGGPSGGSDAANLLKPALARGELRTIAATTWSEYKRYFEKDPALARRFQPVRLDEPSPEDAATILRGLRDAYEAAHGVYIRDDALAAAANLSARYISGRQLPDKAIDVLDTACVRVRLALTVKPRDIDDLERHIARIDREAQALARDSGQGLPVDATRLRHLSMQRREAETALAELRQRWDREQGVIRRIQALRDQSHAAGEEEPDRLPLLLSLYQELEQMQGESPLTQYEVGAEEIAQVVSDWTGVPLGRMLRDETRLLRDLETTLSQRVRGQKDALRAIHETLLAAKAGLRPSDCPLGVFLLVGPSGVGKTETALAVADLLFGGERFMTTINMSEFQEKHTVSRLIGSPPGYVGYGEGGVLTEAVRQRPYSVVLLDEIDKADPEVMNLFYQVFDKGMLADGEGRIIDFKNTVIFMTSNLGADTLVELCADVPTTGMDAMVERIRPLLRRHLKPALLARMQVVPYRPIDLPTLRSIVGMKLAALETRLIRHHNLTLQYAPEVVEAIVARCTEVDSGARNVDHILSRNLLPDLSRELLGDGKRAADENRVVALSLSDSGGFGITIRTA